MKSTALGKNNPHSSKTLSIIIRKLTIFYIIFAIVILTLCFLFRGLPLVNIGNGFIYGSMGLALFGGLLLAVNTIPAQLSKLSIPRYKSSTIKDRNEKEGDEPSSKDSGIRFFFMTLICGACLFLTGFLLILIG